MWTLWLQLARRWRIVSGMNGERLQGLDMTQAESLMRLLGFKAGKQRRITRGLLVMEGAALAAINAECDQT